MAISLTNVCGASFSGTTMLDLMLGNAPNAFSCGEVGAWFRPKRLDRLTPQCPCGADPCPCWQALANVEESRFHRSAAETWGVDHVVDSTKTLSWVFDANCWAFDSAMEVVNVVIWKTPIAHAYSHWKRGTSIAVARQRLVRYYQRFLGLGLPFVAINHDRLAASPALVLADACRASGIAYFPGKERFWTGKHHHLFGNVGTKAQVNQAQGAVKPPTDLPDSFLAEYDRFEVARGADPDLDLIVEMLEMADVAHAPTGRLAPAGSEQSRPVAPISYWYYEDLFKRRSRSFFGRLRPARVALA